jgi:general secretion pathway protein G
MQSTMDRLRQRREELGDEGGFTLIELLIVIVILGILAAIVVFAVQNLTGSSAQSACKSDYKTVETAVEAYNAQVGHYPTVPSDVNTAPTGAPVQPPGDVVNTLMNKQGTVGSWLRDFPGNGSHYQIVVTANGSNPSTISVYKTDGTGDGSGSAGNATPTQLGTAPVAGPPAVPGTQGTIQACSAVS